MLPFPFMKWLAGTLDLLVLNVDCSRLVVDVVVVDINTNIYTYT